MTARFVIPAILQIAVPLAMLGWQAWGRDTNLIAWSLKQTAVWSYIYATSVAGLWLAAPWYVPHVLMVISISLAARTLPGAFRLWRPPATGLPMDRPCGQSRHRSHLSWHAVDGVGGTNTAGGNNRRSGIPAQIRALLHCERRQHASL